MVNTIVEYKNPEDEIALPIKGKKKNLTRNMLINYFGQDKCDLTDKVIDRVLESITSAVQGWRELINISFLSPDMKKKYNDLLNARLRILNLE